MCPPWAMLKQALWHQREHISQAMEKPSPMAKSHILSMALDETSASGGSGSGVAERWLAVWLCPGPGQARSSDVRIEKGQRGEHRVRRWGVGVVGGSGG